LKRDKCAYVCMLLLSTVTLDKGPVLSINTQ